MSPPRIDTTYGEMGPDELAKAAPWDLEDIDHLGQLCTDLMLFGAGPSGFAVGATLDGRVLIGLTAIIGTERAQLAVIATQATAVALAEALLDKFNVAAQMTDEPGWHYCSDECECVNPLTGVRYDEENQDG